MSITAKNFLCVQCARKRHNTSHVSNSDWRSQQKAKIWHYFQTSSANQVLQTKVDAEVSQEQQVAAQLRQEDLITIDKKTAGKVSLRNKVVKLHHINTVIIFFKPH